MLFANSIYRILIYKTRFKYYTIFITLLYKLKAEFAFIIISSHYHYLIRYFSFNYINNFYKSRKHFVYNFGFQESDLGIARYIVRNK
jgi:hypothetical protein